MVSDKEVVADETGFPVGEELSFHFKKKIELKGT